MRGWAEGRAVSAEPPEAERTVRIPRARLTASLVLLALMAVGGAAAEPRLIELALGNGRLPEDRRVVQVQQGDEVTLRWTTDRPSTLHLHGYDIEEKLAPGTPVAVRFTARATGRFPIEIHEASGAERVVGYLESPTGRQALRPGSAYWMPGLTPHDVRNESGRPARMWDIFLKRCD